ncbi:MAG: Type II/IV secretion system ATP hydrolase TadA/VirB11/CpaF, TadA subfamily, partial [uncultured Sphingomonadaceae bacterium]
QHHGGDRHGRRGDRHPRAVQVRISGRERRRQDHRRVPLDGPAPVHAGEGEAVRVRRAVSGGVSV